MATNDYRFLTLWTLDGTIEVSDEEISEALTLCLERTKLLVEGAGAVGLAALLAGRVPGSGSVAAAGLAAPLAAPQASGYVLLWASACWR